MTAYKLRCHKCDDADYPDVGALIDHLRATHDDLYDLTDEDYDTPTDSLYQLRALDVFSDALLFSANAELAERGRMLQEAWKLRGELSSYETFLDSLRTRAKEEIET